MFGNVVLEIDRGRSTTPSTRARRKCKAKLDTDLSADDLKAIVDDYRKLVKEETGKPFPQDPREQLTWRGRRVPLLVATTAANYRRMYEIPTTSAPPSTCRRWCSATWATTPAPASASRATRPPAKEVLRRVPVNAQGEDVVAGIRTPQPIRELERMMPEAYKQLREITTRLEKHYKDIQDFEFTIQDEQAVHAADPQRQAHRRGGGRIAVDMVEGRLIDEGRGGPAGRPRTARPVAAPGVRRRPR